MYTIIYIDNEEVTEILQILTGELNTETFEAGDSDIEYKVCSDQTELNTEALLIDANWLSKFDVIFLKKKI